MKRLLHFSLFTLSLLLSLPSFSQTYKVDEKRIYTRDNTSMPADWKHETTELYTYDNGGNKETKIVGTSASTTENLYQHIKTYNSNNDITLDVLQTWDGAQWVDQSRDTYTYYSGTSNVKDVTTYNFLLGYDTFKVLYEYSGNDLSKITFQDGSLGTLINDEQYEYTYSGGMPYQELDYEWNSSTNMWDLIFRSTASYFPGLREVVVEEYNGGSSYSLFEKYSTYYTISIEKEDEHLEQSWNGSSYDNSDRQLNEYDVNENQTAIELQTWISGGWVKEHRVEMDYSAASLGTESFEKDSFKIYPNPATSTVNIASKVAIDKMELYNMLGKKVMESSHPKGLNVESLNSGIYVLKVFNKEKSVTKKIVVK